MKVIGQDKLITALDSYSLYTAPRTILLIGESGSGKKTIAKHYAEHLGLDLIKINKEDMTQETLTDYLYSAVNKVYLIDLNDIISDIVGREQTILLKFLEEPSDSVYIVLTAESDVGVLPTILNRCITYRLESYSPEILRAQFSWLLNTDNEKVYKICKTPGQLVSVDLKSFEEMYKTCETVLDNIKRIPYENLLKIALKVNLKEDYNKYDLKLFLNTLEFVAFEAFIAGNNDAFIVYQVTNEYRQKLIRSLLSKESTLLSFLTALWRKTR